MGVVVFEPVCEAAGPSSARAGVVAGGGPGGEPVRYGPGAPEPAAAPAASGVRAERVLLADDEQSMRLLLTVNLELAGFLVVSVATGVEALDAARASRFDLLLLDVMMPELNGHEVARELRREPSTSDVPVVFLSARAARDDLLLGYELGAVDYITKPFDPMEIAERLSRVLESVRADGVERVRLARLEQLRG